MSCIIKCCIHKTIQSCKLSNTYAFCFRMRLRTGLDLINLKLANTKHLCLWVFSDNVVLLKLSIILKTRADMALTHGPMYPKQFFLRHETVMRQTWYCHEIIIIQSTRGEGLDIYTIHFLGGFSSNAHAYATLNFNG